jgi:hypothetical protein
LRAYAVAVRTLMAKLVLLVAVLLMPFAMAPAAASAPHQETAIGTAMGHCVDQHQQSKRGIAECTMACAASLPATGAAVMAPIVVVEVLSPSVTTHRLQGLHPEIATPPPRATGLAQTF